MILDSLTIVSAVTPDSSADDGEEAEVILVARCARIQILAKSLCRAAEDLDVLKCELNGKGAVII